MTSTSFVAFRERMGWTKSTMADELQIDRRTERKYETGAPIPRHIALACAALAQGVPPME